MKSIFVCERSNFDLSQAYTYALCLQRMSLVKIDFRDINS